MDQTRHEAIQEVYRLIIGGDADGLINARMLAQELLAEATAAWRHEAPEAGPETAAALLETSTVYAETLLRAADPATAYSTCLTAIAYTARAETPVEPALATYISAWESFQGILAAAAPPQAGQEHRVQPHTEAVATALGTAIYRLYYALGKSDPQSALMDDAYMALRQITSLVELNPASAPDPLHNIASLLDHSQALSLV